MQTVKLFLTAFPAATVAVLLALVPVALLTLGVAALPVIIFVALYAIQLAAILRLVRERRRVPSDLRLRV